MPVGVLEQYDEENGEYCFELARGGDFTEYFDRTGVVIPKTAPVHIRVERRHRVIAPLKEWLCVNLSGQFSVRPGWAMKSHVPITIAFHNTRAAMLFKLRWL